MSNLNLSTSCIAYGADKPAERVQEYLKNSIVNPSQLSQYTSLQSFNEKVSADRIPTILEELRLYEDFCVKNDQYIEADKCVKMIEELQKQEVKVSEKAIKSVNKSEVTNTYIGSPHLNLYLLQQRQMSELEEINLQQFQEFNEIWDKTIEEYTQELKAKETELIQLHEQQLQEFDDSTKFIQFPKTKYSSEVLSLRNLLEQLNKNKRYLESHDIKKRILELEARDEAKWQAVFEQKVASKRVQLIQKQKAELQALQSKLENQLQLKIRTRKQEMNKYAQWLQNMKQELSTAQGLELSRIMVQGEKRTQKVSGGLCNSSMMMSQNYSQLLDMSKSYNSPTHINHSHLQN